MYMGEGRSICTVLTLCLALYMYIPGDLAVPVDVDGLHDVQTAVVQLLLTHLSLQVFILFLCVHNTGFCNSRSNVNNLDSNTILHIGQRFYHR